jgi:hypothetical protein
MQKWKERREKKIANRKECEAYQKGLDDGKSTSDNSGYAKLLKDMRLYLTGKAPLEMKASDLIERIDNFA